MTEETEKLYPLLPLHDDDTKLKSVKVILDIETELSLSVNAYLYNIFAGNAEKAFERALLDWRYYIEPEQEFELVETGGYPAYVVRLVKIDGQ